MEAKVIVGTQMLYSDVVSLLQRRYACLFQEAIPYLRIDPEKIEISDHGLSKGEAGKDFLDGGLGICVRELYKRSIENTQVGYTGKLLAWLPRQFLPEHRHRDIIAAPRNCDLRQLKALSLVRLEEVVAGFSGLVGFDNQNYNFFTQAEDGLTIASSELTEDFILIPGKAETFDIIYGNGSFFLSGRATRNPKYPIPESQYQHVRNKHEFYLQAGQQLKLPPNTPHSARAGPEGMVAIEYSMPSRDEADIFTDPRIKRKVEIKERPKIK